MKALYPGSFNPWHNGHDDIMAKAKKVFDTVDVLIVTKETGLLSTYLANCGIKYDAIVRGLRNTGDFEFEKSVQYYYEDFGIKLPIVYFISDRNVTHVSSSAIRSLQGLK